MKRNCFPSLLIAAASASFAFAAGPASPVRSLAAEEKHEHKDGDKHEEEHKGEKKDLGSQKIGGFDVQVTMIGDLKPGGETIFVLKPTGKGKPKAIRAWVGVENGQGSIKTKAEEEKDGEWHAHHEVAKPLPAKSKVWIEVESATGKQKGSFALPK